MAPHLLARKLMTVFPRICHFKWDNILMFISNIVCCMLSLCCDLADTVSKVHELCKASTSVYQWVWPHLWADTCAVSHARRVHGVGAHWRADDREGGRQAVHGRTQRADRRVKRAGGPHGSGAEQRWVHSPVGGGWAQGRRGHLARWVWMEKQKMTEFRRKNVSVCL